MTDLRLSYHATQRKQEMALTDEETAAVALDPELVYPADSRQGPDRQIHSAAGCAPCTAPTEP